jgi:DNA-binding response OmpR family regulator
MGTELAPSVPPIVLLVDDDRDTLEMYHAYFESSGLWVSTCMIASEALDAVDELQPDIVVTDVGFAGRPDGANLVHTLKNADATRDIPIIVLTGRDRDYLPAGLLDTADLCLVKPVLPDTLLAQVRALLHRSRDLRRRGTTARGKAATLRRKSRSLLGRKQVGDDPVAASCPECRQPLDWIETGSLDGVGHDYFRRCTSGCGLYCYNRADGSWIKLA